MERIALCLCCLVFCFLYSAQAAVVGIDFGAEFIKVSVVKPGAGIEIALNEQSKRKTFSYVGFRNDERYFGEDAYNLHTRFPTIMITYLTHIVGLPYNEDTLAILKNDLRFPFFKLLKNEERGTIDVQIAEDQIYTAEELLGMMLQYIKGNAEKFVEQPVGDAVIAIPASFTMRQREALMNAAALAKLNVLGVMHHTEAAALHYGVQNRGFDKPTALMVFDMGSAKLEVGIFEFNPPDNATAKKKSGDVLGTMTMKGMAFDGNNGGRFFDGIIAGDIAAEYKTKSKNDVLNMNTNAGYKAVTKLMRAAQRAKEMLSANKKALVSVEGIYDEMDFNTALTRERFDELTAPLVKRAIATAEQALQNAGLKAEDITHLELMGGGTRVPALQEALTAWYGKQLGRSLNTDEAIAMGTGFQVAKLSGAFRVRGFSLINYSTYNISFQLSPTEEVPKPAIRKLFEFSKLPSKKLIAVNRTQDFNVTLFMTVKNADGGFEHVPLQHYVLDKVNTSFHAMGFYKEDKITNGSKNTMEIKFKMVDDGVITLEHSQAKYDEVVNATKKVRKVINITDTDTNTTSTETEDGAAPAEPKEGEEAAEGEQKEAEKPAEAAEDAGKEEEKPAEDAAEEKAEEAAEDDKKEDAEGEDKEGEGEAEDGEKKEGDEAKEGDEKKDKKKKKKPKTKVIYEDVPTLKTNNNKRSLTAKIEFVLNPFPMNSSQMQDAKDTLTKLNKRDEEKRKISEAKNNLETLIYDTKYDKFFDDESLKPYYNESEAEAIHAILSEVDEWLEMESNDDTTAKEYKAKIKAIKALTDPVYQKKEDFIESERKKEEERIAAIKKKEAEEKKKAKEEAKKKKKAEEEAKKAAGDGKAEEGEAKPEDAEAKEGEGEAKDDAEQAKSDEEPKKEDEAHDGDL